MTTFIFVHGTFVQTAHWPQLRAALAEIVKSNGAARFEEVPWSGHNRTRARQDGADNLQRIVANIRAADATEKIFIVGHSHGGSAVAYFLKRHIEAAREASGYVFLSTPFVAIRPRARLAGFFELTSILLSILFVISYARVFWTPGASVFELSLFSAGCWGLGLGYSLLILIAYIKRGWISSAVEHALKQQTADLPEGTYLFLRCSGDEAAAALSTAQFITWIATRVSQWIERTFNFMIVKSVGSFILYLFMVNLIGAGATLIFIASDDPEIFFPILGANDPYSKGAIVGVMAATLLAAVCLIAALLIFLLQAVTAWLFGWTDLKTGFLVELAIEPLPFGTHSMTHIDWNVKSEAVEGITHSWTYAHPTAIRVVTMWVSALLAKFP